MNTYVFMTDSDSDLPFRYLDETDIHMVYMPYSLNGKEYMDDLGREEERAKQYFSAMREGAVPVTSQLPMGAYEDYIEPIFAEGKDIFFLAFSSQLSATIQNMKAARDELLEKYPGRKMIIVDSLSISIPQSILILKAYEKYSDGMPIEELADWTEQNRLRTQAFFTVDDLVYLKRGGRISSTAAALGTLLEVKPIITESREGKIESLDKVKGRKKALRTLVELAAERIDDVSEAFPVVAHADDPEDAALLLQMLKDRIPGLPEIKTWPIGPVIGAHCGPGTVAVCFFGKERTV